MSSSALSPAVIAEIASSLQDGRIAITAGVAAGALVTYDFFLSLAQERRHIWARKKSLVFFLFVVLRYATIGYQLTFNLAFFLPIRSNKVRFVAECAGIIYAEQALFILSSSALSGVFALRTFAIYQRNWYILAVLIIVAAVKVFISAVDFFVSAKVTAEAGAFASFASCSSSTAPDAAKWNTASSSLALVFDTIVITLTVFQTARSVANTQRLGLQKNYSFYVLRDGLLYYLAIEILLLFTVIFNQIPSLSIRVARVVIILQTSLAPVLAQRLMLNLRTVDFSKPGTETSGMASMPGEVEFAHGTILGNIGAPLRTVNTQADGDGEFDEFDESGIVETPREPLEVPELNHLDGVQMVEVDENMRPYDVSKDGVDGPQSRSEVAFIAV